MKLTSSERAELVREQASSGQSVPEFCARRGLREKSFYVWRQRARALEGQFARIQTDKRIEIELKGGAILRVALEDLKAVIEALR